MPNRAEVPRRCSSTPITSSRGLGVARCQDLIKSLPPIIQMRGNISSDNTIRSDTCLDSLCRLLQGEGSCELSEPPWPPWAPQLPACWEEERRPRLSTLLL